MAFAALRAKKISHHLHRHLHHCVVCLRRVHISGVDSDCARGAGRGRRSAAAVVTIDSAGNFSSAEARAGYGCIWPGRGGRAGIGTYAGRLAHRRLLLEMGVLHQHSRRHLRHIHDFALCGRSSVHQRRASRQVRWYRAGIAGGLARRSADYSRQRTGGRLVWRNLDSLGGGDSAHQSRVVSDTRV